MKNNSQEEFINYLGRRLEKLSKDTIGNQDLDTLVDVQNEIIINNTYNIKNILNKNTEKQIENLQRKIEISEKYIDYLENSFWWKATIPFRYISRKIRKNIKSKRFDYSKIITITEKTSVIIYISNLSDNILEQIKNLNAQKGFKKIKISLFDLTNSSKIAQIAKDNKINYLSSFAIFNDLSQAEKILSDDAAYIISISQNIIINNELWLYKMVRPIIENYASLSALYNKNLPQIKNIKNGTYFGELRARIFEIENYDCLLLPNNRNSIQYIPLSITDDAAAIAKRRY